MPEHGGRAETRLCRDGTQRHLFAAEPVHKPPASFEDRSASGASAKVLRVVKRCFAIHMGSGADPDARQLSRKWVKDRLPRRINGFGTTPFAVHSVFRPPPKR